MRAQLLNVDVNVPSPFDTEDGVIAGLVEATCRSDEGLGGDTRHVNARAADELSFNERDLPSVFRAVHCQ